MIDTLLEEVEACDIWAWSMVARRSGNVVWDFGNVVGSKWIGCRSSYGVWSDPVVFSLGVFGFVDRRVVVWCLAGGGDGRGLRLK